MARDGLLPKWAARIHPRYLTPVTTTILTGVFVAFFSAFANINEVIELTNIGTLFAFVLVSVGILVLRWREPDAIKVHLPPVMAKKGISFRAVAADRLEPTQNRLTLVDGTLIDYDYLVIATGPKLAFDEVPGLGTPASGIDRTPEHDGVEVGAER